MEIEVIRSGDINPSGPEVVPESSRATESSPSFLSTFEQALGLDRFGSGYNVSAVAAQSRAILGQTPGPRELLLMQIQMGRFNLQVELVSRVAESATSTIKRLQNG